MSRMAASACVPVREQVAEDRALGGQPAHVDGRLGDDAEPALGAEHHLAHARAGRGGGHGARDERARRRDDPHRARELGDVAVAVGLHARRAGGDPAAERRVREGVGEVAERPAALVELALQLRTEHAGLHARQARRSASMSSTRSSRCRSTRDHGPRLVARRLQAAGDARPAAERDHDRVVLERGAHDRRSPRPRRRGGRPRRAAGRARRRAGGRGRAGSCRGRARPDRAGRSRRSGSASRSASGRLGSGTSSRSKSIAGAPGARHVEIEVLLQERRERGLVLVGERDVRLAPAPPLHRRRRNLGCMCGRGHSGHHAAHGRLRVGAHPAALPRAQRLCVGGSPGSGLRGGHVDLRGAPRPGAARGRRAARARGRAGRPRGRPAAQRARDARAPLRGAGHRRGARAAQHAPHAGGLRATSSTTPARRSSWSPRSCARCSPRRPT